MMKRYEVSASQWRRMEGFLPGRAGHVGVTAKDNRQFVNGVPRLHEGKPMGAAQRSPVERPAPWVRQLEEHPQAFHPLGQSRVMGEDIPTPAG